jgi:hypothetical protein
MTNQQSLPIVNTLFLLVILGKEDNMYKFRWVCNDSLSKLMQLHAFFACWKMLRHTTPRWTIDFQMCMKN